REEQQTKERPRAWLRPLERPRNKAQTPQHLRQETLSTARDAESAYTPFPQDCDALALDRGRGPLSEPLCANTAPDCGPRWHFKIGPCISTGSDERGTGEGRCLGRRIQDGCPPDIAVRISL